MITVAARSSIELPLSDVFRDGRAEVYPEIEEKGLLFLQFQGGKIRLTAGKYIGLIPFNNRITVEVRPKLPVGNLVHVLETAQASLRSVGLERSYDILEYQGATVLEFLLNNLIRSIRDIERFGYLKCYVKNVNKGELRGRLVPGQTLKLLWGRGQRYKVISESFEQTVDVAENRIIKFALEKAMQLICRVRPSSSILRAASLLYNRFPKAVSNINFKDIEYCFGRLRNRDLPISREYYYRSIEISCMIIGDHAISLDGHHGDVKLETFVINFEEVFENYLRQVLNCRRPIECLVKDGNGDGARPLYDNYPAPLAQPDIVMEKSGNHPLIIEVKYKDKPDRADINQVVTYAATYRAKTAVLVHQAKSISQVGGKLRGVIDGLSIYSYGFDLSANDLSQQEMIFSEEMVKYLLGN